MYKYVDIYTVGEPQLQIIPFYPHHVPCTGQVLWFSPAALIKAEGT